MNFNKINKNRGFTIIEALVAIFILVFAMTSLISLTASSLNLVKYANNEITTDYLLQEAIDSIKNNRDSIAFQQVNTFGHGWSGFLGKYGYPNSKCFSTNGCILLMDKFNSSSLDNSNEEIKECNESSSPFGSIPCPVLRLNNYDNNSVFYSYDPSANLSNFKRQVKMETSDVDNSVKITVTVEWLNGKTTKTKSLGYSLLNWQKN